MNRPVERCAVKVRSTAIDDYRRSQTRTAADPHWRIITFCALVGAAIGLLISA